MTSRERVKKPVDLSPLITERIRQSGLDFDLSNTSVVEAILEAVYRRGMADRMILDSMDRGDLTLRRRGTSERWQSTGPGGHMFGEYMMTRVGHGGVNEPPGAGWYVEGPGVERTFVGRTRREAQMNASQIVNRAKESCS